MTESITPQQLDGIPGQDIIVGATELTLCVFISNASRSSVPSGIGRCSENG